MAVGLAIDDLNDHSMNMLLLCAENKISLEMFWATRIVVIIWTQF